MGNGIYGSKGKGASYDALLPIIKGWHKAMRRYSHIHRDKDGLWTVLRVTGTFPYLTAGDHRNLFCLAFQSMFVNPFFTRISTIPA